MTHAVKDGPGRDYTAATIPCQPIVVCMAPTNKAQAAGVSSGSFLELRAQVAKHKESLSNGNATAVVGGKKSGKVRVHSSRPLICALFA